MPGVAAVDGERIICEGVGRKVEVVVDMRGGVAYAVYVFCDAVFEHPLHDELWDYVLGLIGVVAVGNGYHAGDDDGYKGLE